MFIRKKSEVIKKFLVLSDLHIDTKSDSKTPDKYEKFEASLIKFLVKKSKEGKIDYILLVGDLTDRNDKEGYTRLHETLKKIYGKDIIESYSNIICCPGNHDLDRSCIFKTYELIQKLKSKNYKGKISDWLCTFLSQDPYQAYRMIENIHQEKFPNYIDFINGLYPRLGVREVRRKAGFTLNLRNELLITSLNSSWYCNYPDGRHSDAGRLVLGMNFVKESMKVSGNCGENVNMLPRITIMHHPPEAFVWAENYGRDKKLNTMQYITKNSSLVINGHVHGLPRTMGYLDDAYLISNGTSFNDHEDMSFLMFELNIYNGQVELSEYFLSRENLNAEPQLKHSQSFKAPLMSCKTLYNVA